MVGGEADGGSGCVGGADKEELEKSAPPCGIQQIHAGPFVPLCVRIESADTISPVSLFYFLYPSPSRLSHCNKTEYLFPRPQRSSLKGSLRPELILDSMCISMCNSECARPYAADSTSLILTLPLSPHTHPVPDVQLRLPAC